MWVLEISNLPLNIPQNGEFSAQNLALLGENFLTIFQQPRIFFFGGGRKSHPPCHEATAHQHNDNDNFTEGWTSSNSKNTEYIMQLQRCKQTAVHERILAQYLH